MPDGLAPQVIATAGPLVFATFLEHYLTPKKRDAEGKKTAGSEDLMYDEAFQIGKTFMKIANDHTCASLQKFGATRTPAPPWVAVHRLIISPQSLSQSADFLVKALGGEDMAYKIAGGSKWWQVRAGHGVEAEWIVMKDEYRKAHRADKKHMKEMRKETQDTPAESRTERADSIDEEGVRQDEEDELDSGFIPEMDRLRCMLYIHGGAYYWGSINTHRYTIWRFARKMHGRCFAVNYRKAPQYPFPCAIQDVLAAYLYLVNPPKDAPHRPVNPKDIIIAGDSAGGGLTWALLQILRDTPGLELPAGAVLISPWSDLTHSFPSVMKNTATDVVPAYSFIHKPSSLWPPPPPPLTEEMQSNITRRVKLGAQKLRHPSSTYEETDIIDSAASHKQHRRKSIHTSDPEASGRLHKLFQQKKADIKAGKEDSQEGSRVTCINPSENFFHLEPRGTGPAYSTLAQVGRGMRMDVYGEEVVLDTQIQLYCTNGQLCHPWISPVLGYLGGLPPLYILAGDDEVLRDEIIYCAHKAARPDEYPLRDDVRDLLPSMKDIEAKHKPTEVHLQVFDGVGHDLTLFSMTKPARGAYRSIATFCRYVTPSNPGGLPSEESTPVATPGTQTPLRQSTVDTVTIESATPRATGPTTVIQTETQVISEPLVETPRSGLSIDTNITSPSSAPSPSAISQRLQKLRIDSRRQEPSPVSPSSRFSRMSTMLWQSPIEGSPGGNDLPKAHHRDRAHHYPPGTCGYPGIYAGPNPFRDDHMIRERVDFSGNIRPLEPADQLPACTMPLSETGMIKEGPAMRYIEGQAKWDRKFSRVRKKVARHRRKNLKQAHEHDATEIERKWGMMGQALAAPAQAVAGQVPTIPPPKAQGDDETVDGSSTSSLDSDSDDDAEDMDVLGATWGWALNGEAPPPSAIVSRRDLPEGRQLALLGAQAETSTKQSPALSLWVVMATLLGGSGKELMTDAARIRMEQHDKHVQHKRERKEREAAEDGKPHPLRRLTHMFKK